MRGSYRLGRWLGIDVYMHWSFLALLAIFSLLQISQGIGEVFAGFFFLVSLFTCVVLHEYGHAMMARYYKIPTKDITLLPIGGVARLTKMPEKPTEELLVALAGPAVNVVIAFLLGVFLFFYGSLGVILNFSYTSLFGTNFLEQMLFINIALLVFNLLPAFPMDGGRVLRALLGYKLTFLKATRIAAKVGQAMAILFFLVGIYFGNWSLFLISMFVYYSAGAEAKQVEWRSAMEHLTVRSAMITHFPILLESDPLQRVATEFMSGARTDFPVYRDYQLVGMLERQQLFQAISNGAADQPVAHWMNRKWISVPDTQRLSSLYQYMLEKGVYSSAVMKEGVLVGMITLERIVEYARTNQPLQRNSMNSFLFGS